jgi:flagellar basal body-associated protein FliL
MASYILMPVIAAVGISAVVGIRALYNQTESKEQEKNPLAEYTRNVDEYTRNLANGGK